jgi:hypothetical protein
MKEVAVAETYTGQVLNGVIVLDEGMPALPEGTRVRVEPVDLKAAVQELSQILLEFAGSGKELPPDLAEQHDHYLHGTPKR